jgi:hypothetical protein
VRARFSAHARTGRGTHPASCTMGTGSFLGVKRPGRGADHPHPSSAEVKERVKLYIYFPSGPSWPVLGELYSKLEIRTIDLCIIRRICLESMCTGSTDMRRLTTEIRSENCVVRQFRRRMNVIECTYTNLDSTAYYTPSLYIASCS